MYLLLLATNMAPIMVMSRQISRSITNPNEPLTEPTATDPMPGCSSRGVMDALVETEGETEGETDGDTEEEIDGETEGDSEGEEIDGETEGDSEGEEIDGDSVGKEIDGETEGEETDGDTVSVGVSSEVKTDVSGSKISDVSPLPLPTSDIESIISVDMMVNIAELSP